MQNQAQSQANFFSVNLERGDNFEICETGEDNKQKRNGVVKFQVSESSDEEPEILEVQFQSRDQSEELLQCKRPRHEW